MKVLERLQPHGMGACAAVAIALVIAIAAQAQDGTSPPAGSPGATGPVSTVRMTRPGTFEIHVQGADLRGVLQLLSTQGRKNIIATKEVTGKVTANLYGVTFKEALEAVLGSTGFVYRERGNFIYVYTPKQLEEIAKAERKMAVRVFRLAYATADDAKALIAPILSSEGTVAVTPSAAVGIATSSSDTGGNSHASSDVLVVHDYEDNLKQITKIVRALDVKPEQVLVEATILRATLTESNALGIDFNALAGIDFEAMNSSSAGLQSMTTSNITGSGLNQARNGAATFRTDFNSAVPSGGLTIGFVTNEAAFFLRALESVTDVTVLANPKLLVVNKQRGEVMVGNRNGYLTTTVTETVATQTVEFLETGTRLVLRPFIGRNGFIRMEIHPEDSSGSVEQVGTNVLPSETTTEVTSNVLVRDGHTIVIGGLFRERTSNGRSQVPLLGDIPYLGAVFRSTDDDTVREEVIILITPRIIKQAQDEAVCEQLKDDVERFRIGQRKGMRWWGRSRLAQSYLRKAKQDLSAGRMDKSLWNIDSALSLEPRMEEAIRIKERLTRKAYWSDQAQYSSVKYIVQRMIMQELGVPVERVIPPAKPRDVRILDQEARKALGIETRPEDPLPGPAQEQEPADTEGNTEEPEANQAEPTE